MTLVAARIARSLPDGRWLFDDFATADAIEWCWSDEGADVLSCSWGGGPPVDAIRNAIHRARTLGRSGRGCVVVFAAGNLQRPVSFPATTSGVMVVGASNQWDERKTRASRDGETWWGSNFGRELSLLAPGVAIATTDIHGRRGYGRGDYIRTFNGTSASAPHVSAAAALVLSVAPRLSEDRVREIIVSTAERLPGQRGWTPRHGAGRLHVYACLRAAQRAGHGS